MKNWLLINCLLGVILLFTIYQFLKIKKNLESKINNLEFELESYNQLKEKLIKNG